MLRQSFRAWLAEKLLTTVHARATILDEEIDARAKRLGIDADLLLEVRARFRIEQHARGLPSPYTSSRQALTPEVSARHRRLYQLHLPMPVEILAAWKDECEFRGIEGSAILRSLIHSYLLASYEPKCTTRFWYWKGRRYECGKNATRLFERATIPTGAKRALTRRAARRGTSSVAIARGLALEVLEGKHRELALIDPMMMFDDESRYGGR